MNDNMIMFTNRCHFIVIAISIVVIFTSLLAFVGMVYNIPWLIRISPSWINIKANTALCFFLAGFAVLLMSNQYRKFFNNTLLALISICILLISSLTLYEYVAGMDLHIDQFLLNDNLPLSEGSFAPGRMALTSAINFILFAGACLLSIKKNSSPWTIQFLAWMIQFIAYISSFNYLYGADVANGFSRYTTMAAQTNVLFILLSIAILLIKPDSGIVGIILGKNTSGYLLRRIIAIPIIVPTLVLYAEIILQREKLIDAFSAQVITQIMIFAITGIMIALVAYLLDLKEKNLATALTQAEHNELIFHRFAENIDIVFYTASPDLSQVLYVSPAYEKIWGKSRDSLYKNPKEWFEAILPEDQNIAYETLLMGLENGKSMVSANYRIKRPDGSIRNIFDRIVQVKDEKNAIFCVIGISIDMTDVTVEVLYKELQSNILHLIENENTIHDLSPRLIRSICHALKWDFGELWLIDEPQNLLHYAGTWNKDSKILKVFTHESSQKVLQFGEGLPGRVWKEKGIIWMPAYSSYQVSSRTSEAASTDIHSAIGIPIIYQQQVYGILNFFNSNIQEPSKELLTLMRNIGSLIGHFIARTYTTKQIYEMSRHDMLTGLLNWSALEKNINTLISGGEKIITVMMIDIDHFKLINESLGYACGDSLLKAVGARLTDAIEHQKNNIARLGTDKFFLFLTVINRTDAFNYARAIHNKFSVPFHISENEIILTVTIGIAMYPENGLDGNTLMVNANLALNQAKDKSGNRIHFSSKELPFISANMIAMNRDLRQAMLNNQFILEYQPQIDLLTGSICAAEAVVRWRHPVSGLMYPNAFVPFAEKLGLIVPLNEHIMSRIFQQISTTKWSLPISINISVKQFQEGFHLVEYIESLMKEFSVNAQQIEFEITENIIMENTEHNIAVLNALHQLGFQIAVDDFGTGFSSFSYLNHFPVHKIKIDRSFITGLPDKKENVKIVKAIIPLVHALDMIVVAEGAETKAEVEFLKQEKCDIVQGFYYYKPMSFDKLITLMDKK